MLEKSEYGLRRSKLLDAIGAGNAGILFAAQELIRNGDVHFPFRQESDFFYFTGFNEPQAVAVFLPGHKEGEFILFNRAKDPLIERWVGVIEGQEGACRTYGANSSFAIEQLEDKILQLLGDRKKIFYPMGRPYCDHKVTDWIGKLQEKNRRTSVYPVELADIRDLSAEMRLIKSAKEIEYMRKAAEISAAGHSKVMRTIQPGMYEYEIEALLNYELAIRGCRYSAYPAIVGGGGNACVLHYVNNQDLLKDGDLVLIDAGGEYENYAADITRTFPVNGKFSKEQALVYECVLRAQKAVIAEIKPGILWNRLQEIAVEILTDGLLSMGILSGKASDAIQNRKYLDFYMHNIGHWLGIDVHDVGKYKVSDQWRPLQPGMVLTVEPGLYLGRNPRIPKRFWDIGVRIEDDVLVTAEGCEVLSSAVPKEIAEIENLMAQP